MCTSPVVCGRGSWSWCVCGLRYMHRGSRGCGLRSTNVLFKCLQQAAFFEISLLDLMVDFMLRKVRKAGIFLVTVENVHIRERSDCDPSRQMCSSTLIIVSDKSLRLRKLCTNIHHFGYISFCFLHGLICFCNACSLFIDRRLVLGCSARDVEFSGTYTCGTARTLCLDESGLQRFHLLIMSLIHLHQRCP